MDRYSLNGYRASLGFIYDEIIVQNKDFGFGKDRVWFDEKQHSFELI